MKALLLLAVVAAASVAATLDAQGTKAQPDSSCTKYSDGRLECRVFRTRTLGDSTFGNRIFLRVDSAMAKRAALGIELRATGTRRDTLGVFVEGVTPKGPAESAGIVEGDRIAAINGVDLRTQAADTDDPYSNGMAAHRLTREVEKLTPGSRVILRIYSGGRFRDVPVVARKASDVMRFSNRFRVGFPGPDGMMEFGGPDGRMMLPQNMKIFRDRELEPLIRENIEHLQNLPDQIRLRAPIRVRALAPARRVVRMELSAEGELQPVTAETIRELAANAARDAKSALRKLAEDGVV